MRAIARLKGQIADRMFELDPEEPSFWREHRDAIIRDSILTTHKREYSSHILLSKKLLRLGENPLPNDWTLPAFCQEVFGDTENLPIVLDAVRDLYFNGLTGECYIQAVAVLVNIGGGT